MFKVIQKKPEKAPRPETVASVPSGLKKQAESLAGLSLDAVRIHYSSDKPAQLQALAFAQGNRVYLGKGQEHLLPHELAHVIQQRQGRVGITGGVGGQPLNDSAALEREADSFSVRQMEPPPTSPPGDIVQRVLNVAPKPTNPSKIVKVNSIRDFYDGEIAKGFDIDAFIQAEGGVLMTATAALPNLTLVQTTALAAVPLKAVEGIICQRLNQIVAALPSAPAIAPAGIGAFLTAQLAAPPVAQNMQAELLTLAMQPAAPTQAAPILGCMPVDIGLKANNYSKRGVGDIYKKLEDNKIITPGAIDNDNKILLGHQGGDQAKIFGFQPFPNSPFYQFASGRHADTKAMKMSGQNVYLLEAGFGAFADFNGKYILLLSDSMMVGGQDEVKYRTGTIL